MHHKFSGKGPVVERNLDEVNAVGPGRNIDGDAVKAWLNLQVLIPAQHTGRASAFALSTTSLWSAEINGNPIGGRIGRHLKQGVVFRKHLHAHGSGRVYVDVIIIDGVGGNGYVN